MSDLESIKLGMAKLREKLDKLQSNCQHINVEKKYKASTGNWCKSDDEYWIDFHCKDCDKRWSTPQ